LFRKKKKKRKKRKKKMIIKKEKRCRINRCRGKSKYGPL